MTDTTPGTITSWKDVYTVLLADGENTRSLAALAGLSRAAVCAVLAGTYPHNHQPKFGPGVDLLVRLRRVPDVIQRIDRRRITELGQFVPDQYTPRTGAGEPAGTDD